MERRYGDHWLVLIGLPYGMVSIGGQIWGGGILWSWQATPILIMVLCSLAAGLASAVWVAGADFRWWSAALFVLWLVVVVMMQLSILALAAASV